MKDSLGDLFRERFHGHEVPVAPGTWQAIQSQIVAAPVPQEPVPGQLQEKFAGHEVHMDAAVWQNISAHLGHGVVAGSTGGGIFGWVAAVVAGLLIVGGLAYTFSSEEPTALAHTPSAPAVFQNAAPNADPNSNTPSATTIAEPAQAEQYPLQPAVAAPAVPTQPKVITAGANPPQVNEPASGEGALDPSEEMPTRPERSGAEVVNRIIADMTSLAEQEVRSSTPVVPPPTIGGTQQPTPETGAPIDAATEPSALPEVFLPNTFTPNNDGINDDYRIGAAGFSSVMVRVYSLKNNQLVFSSSGSALWTGADCEDGMYLVAVEAVTLDGRSLTEGKVVWLNRNSMN